MYRRWREELRKHTADDGTVEGDCHCLRGIGFMRKRRPHDCGKTRCGICHYSKFYVAKARAAEQREALSYESRAAGLCPRALA